MWKRNSDDPLARILLDRYSLHLLRQPRADVGIGDVYPVQDGQVFQPGRLVHLLEPPPVLPPVREGEPMADVAGKLQASFGTRHVRGLRFRFSRATRDYVDPFHLERVLRKHEFVVEDSLLKKDQRYYLVLGVVRSDAISLTAIDDSKKEVSLDIDAIELAGARAGFSTSRSSGAETTFVGPERLAFGVELSEMIYSERRTRLELTLTKGLIQVRAGAEESEAVPAIPRYDLIGGPNDDIYLPLHE